MNYNFKAGDTIRKRSKRSFLRNKNADPFTATVSGYRHGRVTIAETDLTYPENQIKLVVPACDPADPPKAPGGLYIVVRVCGPMEIALVGEGSYHRHWVDAEAHASLLAERTPNSTFGVLKLVGTVSMKPQWS